MLVRLHHSRTCLLHWRSTAITHLLVCSLTHSLARGNVIDCLAIFYCFFFILDHSEVGNQNPEIEMISPGFFVYRFSDATTPLYERKCRSVRPSVCPMLFLNNEKRCFQADNINYNTMSDEIAASNIPARWLVCVSRSSRCKCCCCGCCPICPCGSCYV